MNKHVKITPKFDEKKIIDETIGKIWFEFQNKAFQLKGVIAKYGRDYINNNRKRSGGTGNLSKNIKANKGSATSGAGEISWGVGDINKLMQRAPYYYVCNFGKTVSGQPYVPNNGAPVPGSFGGNPPRGNSSNSEHFDYKNGNYMMKPRKPIRPMNYISAMSIELDKQLDSLLSKLKGK